MNKNFIKGFYPTEPLEITQVPEAWFPYNFLVPAAYRRLTGDIELFDRSTSFQLPATQWRPTSDMEEKLRLVQLFPIAVPVTSRNLHGNMTAMVADGSLTVLISHFLSFHSLCTVTPSAKAAFQGAVKNFKIKNTIYAIKVNTLITILK